MRRIFLAALPVVLFIGAMMAFAEPKAPAVQAAPHPEYRPAEQPPAVEAPQAAPERSPPPEAPPAAQPQPQQHPAPKPVVYVDVKECSDGAGATAYELESSTQVQPAGGSAPQCASPLAVIEGGKRYFGCADGGKIILDCDWFVQTIGSETQGQSAAFGSSSIGDFRAPDVSGFTCSQARIDQSLLLRPSGKICDIQTLIGNIGQAHGD